VELWLKWNQAWQLRREIFKLKHLHTLALPNIVWKSQIPQECCSLKTLKTLHVSNLPSGMRRLCNLETLMLGHSSGSRLRIPPSQFQDLPPNLKMLHIKNRVLDHIPSSLPSTLLCMHLAGCCILDEMPDDANFPATLRTLRLESNIFRRARNYSSALTAILQRNERLQILLISQPWRRPGSEGTMFTPEVAYLSVLNGVCGNEFIRSNTSIPPSCWSIVFGKVSDKCKCNCGLPEENLAEAQASVLFTLLHGSVARLNFSQN